MQFRLQFKVRRVALVTTAGGVGMPVYGGFWIRVGAYLIDAILLAIAGAVVGGILGVGIGLTELSGQQSADPSHLGLQLLSFVINLSMGWLYSALMESSANQATLGKMALGLVVTDQMGNRIGFGRATGRYLAKFVSAFVLMIGFIMVGFTERKQGLHDMIAGTLVSKKGTITGTNAADVFS